MASRKIECRFCDATGLYHGFMEGPGEYVICVRCGGNGWLIDVTKAFKRRKERKGVKKVRFGSGLIVDNPKTGQWMSYSAFKKLILES